MPWFSKAAVIRSRRLFIKNTGLRKVEILCMGADACPVLEGEGNLLAFAKLVT